VQEKEKLALQSNGQNQVVWIPHDPASTPEAAGSASVLHLMGLVCSLVHQVRVMHGVPDGHHNGANVHDWGEAPDTGHVFALFAAKEREGGGGGGGGVEAASWLERVRTSILLQRGGGAQSS
jgi:hypothetical protein